jgi:DNA-binding NarL/FixJ family response regulator
MGGVARGVRVLVVDDHPTCRYALKCLIEDTPDMVHVGSAADGREAIGAVLRLDPDVVVLDLELPTVDGLTVLREIRAIGGTTQCLVLSAHRDGRLIHDALASGACGFLSKGSGIDEIRTAIRHVAHGRTVIASDLEQSLAQHVRRQGVDPTPDVTAREREVLRLVAAGFSTPEIAKHLSLSETTVKTHLSRAFAKLGVSDRTAAVVEALRAGIIDVGLRASPRPTSPPQPRGWTRAASRSRT